MKRKLFNLAFFLTATSLGSMSFAQMVTSNADNGTDGTLRKEIADTPPGGTVTVSPLVLQAIALDSAITINKTLIITGTALGTAVDGQGASRIFNIVGGQVIISNFNFQNGLAANGGAIQVANGSLTVTNCEFDGNVANDAANGSGGAIFVSTNASLIGNGCSFTNNQANRAGGAIEVNSGSSTPLLLTNCDFDGNNAGVAPATAVPGNGGAIHITGATPSTITGGTASNNTAALEGGAYWNGTGIMVVNNVTFSGNSAEGAAANEGGGALFNAGGQLFVRNSALTNNSATGAAGSGGGILNDMGVLVVDTTSFTGNSAMRAGGAIEENSAATAGVLTIRGCTMTNNTTGSAPGNGGAIHITGANNSFLSKSTFTGNTAASEGGAIWNASGAMVIDSCIIDANTAQGAASNKGGGGIFNVSGVVSVVNESVVSNNLATGISGSGGGLMSKAGTINILNSTFSANSANRAGGAIEIIDGTMIIEKSALTDNDVDGGAGTPAPGSGGAIHVTGNTTLVSLDSVNVTGNAAALAGGGLWNQSGSMMNLNFVWVDNNTAGMNGGGIYNTGGTMSISRSAVTNNEAGTGTGGGISNNSGEMSVDHSTISTNTSQTMGGGIYSNDTLSLNAVTVYNNTTTNNGGGVYAGGSALIKNSIFSDNMAMLGQELDGNFTSGGYNLVQNDDNNVLTLAMGDTIDVTPMLGTLLANGGFAPSHALLVGSVGIDMGDPADTTRDQRNRSVFNTIRDMGAFEYTGNVGIKELAKEDIFGMYPNPTSTLVNIASKVEGTLLIVDINGKEVYRSTVANGVHTVDASNFQAGMYMVTVKGATSAQTAKLIVR